MRKRPGVRSLYPWGVWLDPQNKGKRWKLRQGREFHCQQTSMAVSIYQWSLRKGVKVSLTKRENGDIILENLGRRKRTRKTGPGIPLKRRAS